MGRYRYWSGPVWAVVAFAAGMIAAAPIAEAASHQNHHRDAGYGVQGGVSPDLALANVYSGIYGLQYTYDRAHYDFNGCRARDIPADGEDLTIRPCR